MGFWALGFWALDSHRVGVLFGFWGGSRSLHSDSPDEVSVFGCTTEANYSTSPFGGFRVLGFGVLGCSFWGFRILDVRVKGLKMLVLVLGL